MAVHKLKTGIIGCGNISGIYMKTCPGLDSLDLAACADLIPERAQAQAEEYSIPRTCTVEELLKDPEIEIIINLTIPKAHAEVAMAAVENGKSVYNEKPITVTREQGMKLLAAAESKGVLVGGAPDTFMGAGLQTCRKLIDDGAVGTPVAATAFMLCRGHETWHPAPEFYYKTGGGPMFDMGPYYLTALIHLLGPIKRVTGSARASFHERTITSEPKNGEIIQVETPTHIAGIMEFEQGSIGTIVTSFDVYGGNVPRIEIYGSEGTLSVPDPNSFGGPVRLYRPADEKDWEEMPLTHAHPENSRGLGVADMAYALQIKERTHRASGELAYHVLDTMHAFLDASEAGTHIDIESTCTQPEPIPSGLAEGTLDE